MSDEVDTQKRNLRPFTRRGRATGDGNIVGTTIVSLWDPAVPEGLDEADDYWNDGQIRILTGEMADQKQGGREIIDWDQATGTLTVAPRFVNPAVSLLTVDSPAADVVIDVADASVFTDGSLLVADVAVGGMVIFVADASIFRVGAAFIWDTVTPAGEVVAIINVNTLLNMITIAPPGIVFAGGYLVANAASISMAGNAYIWDDTPDAEAVTIIGINLALNQLTIAPPGIVAATGYTLLQNAAISMSPTILDDVEFTLMPPTRTVDTGEHTNTRRYEKDYGFVTLPIARAGAAATAVWDVGVACIRNPSGIAANGRTAGGISSVYTLELENPDAAAQTAWLEDGAGVVLSVIYHIATMDTVVIDYPAGKTFGDIDLFINASIDGIVCQISGTEE